MKLIKPSYEIVSHPKGEEAIVLIEKAARTCYKSEGKIEHEVADYTDGVHSVVIGKTVIKATSGRELVRKLLLRGHDAMLEFGGNLHVLFVCDRGVSHELVRHRLASFAQESTRYCNYGKDEHVQFIIPPWIDDLLEGEYIAHAEYHHAKDDVNKQWYDVMMNAEFVYNDLIVGKWTPQQARSVLPNSLKTEINVSANLREWRHIFKQRCSTAAHPQMRELMIPLLNEMKNVIPIVFDDLQY